MSIEIQLSDMSVSEEIITNNQRIAHDLQSPISALNFVSSLNPELPEDSRSLLQMAINRLTEIAKTLESK